MEEIYQPMLRDGAISHVEGVDTKIERTLGSMLLWRGGDELNMDKFFATGKVDHLASRWSTDSRGREGLTLYFAVDKVITQRYQQWAKTSWGAMTTALLWMEVSNTLIAKSKSCILRYDGSSTGQWKTDEWKQIIYASRRGERFPKHLTHFKHCQLFIGHICKKANECIEDLASWKDITDKYLFNLNEGILDKAGNEIKPHFATQYVFFGDEIADKLREKAKFGFDGQDSIDLP